MRFALSSFLGTIAVFLVLALLGCGSSSTNTQAITGNSSGVIAWNSTALQVVAAERMMPPQASRCLSMMHAAMYDAVNAVEKRGHVYKADVSAPLHSSAEAASAQAAYRILLALYPTQTATLDARLASSLAVIPDGLEKNNGIAVGNAVAEAILSWRSNDGAQAMGMGTPYTGGTACGQWRPTPPDNLPGAFVSWRNVTPFALTAANQFRPGPPPALDSAAYATAYHETKTIGAKTSTTRTMDQSMIANFWVGMPGTVTEVGRMNQVAQQATATHQLDLFQSVRLFALVNIAMADAAIAGIDCKYTYSFWRPLTAIQNAVDDNNPQTDDDAAWEPYLANPAHPEYISTHSALTKAAATVLSGVLNTDTADLTLPAFMDANMTRHYTRFSQVAEEAGLSRIYGGIHFRFSYDAGTQLGAQIGEYTTNNCMRLK